MIWRRPCMGVSPAAGKRGRCMNLSMSDNEIRSLFTGAKNQKAEVKILAELNNVPSQTMVEKLRELGFEVPDPPKAKEKLLGSKDVLFDEAEVGKLMAEGRTDQEIAASVGVSERILTEWRRKQVLRRTRGPAKGTRSKPKSKLAPTPPEAETPKSSLAGAPENRKATIYPCDAERLGEMLVELAKRYPGLTITVNGAAIRKLCLKVCVRMDTADMRAGVSSLDLEVG